MDGAVAVIFVIAILIAVWLAIRTTMRR